MNQYTKDAVQLLPQILQLSMSMREQAEASMWDEVRQQEAQRQQLIDVCFPLEGSVVDKEAAADQIRKIIDIDREIVGMLEVSRRKVGGSLSRMNRGRQATRHYRAVGQ